MDLQSTRKIEPKEVSRLCRSSARARIAGALGMLDEARSLGLAGIALASLLREVARHLLTAACLLDGAVRAEEIAAEQEAA